MTSQQLKSEIQKTLDRIPENVLQDILNYLKLLQHKTSDQLQLSQQMKQILAEDKELLEKLAQ